MGLEELEFGDKSKDDKIIDWFVFDRLDTLNRSWPFIFIGWGGLAPNRVETLANPVPKYNFYTDSTDRNRSDRPCELV